MGTCELLLKWALFSYKKAVCTLRYTGANGTPIYFVCLLFIFSAASAQEHSPGVERWSIKTSLPEDPEQKTVTLKKMLTLPNPIARNSADFDEERISKKVKGLKEGDIITIKGWLHLVALENDSKKHRDGDYHIQLRNSALWGDSCFIIEMPLPAFISDPALRKQCKQAREFVRRKLLKNREPGTSGNVMKSEVFVSVSGQLFFDASHMKGKPRGKKGMKSYTPWEIHPVTQISFAPKPQR